MDDEFDDDDAHDTGSAGGRQDYFNQPPQAQRPGRLTADRSNGKVVALQSGGALGVKPFAEGDKCVSHTFLAPPLALFPFRPG